MTQKRTSIVMEELRSERYIVVVARRLRRRIGLTETRRIACATLQSALAAGVLMFYSRSLVGAVIRAL